MNNPYTVSLSLNSFDIPLGLDKDNKTLWLVVAKSGDIDWKHVLDLTKKIRIQEFRISEEEGCRTPLESDAIHVPRKRLEKCGGLRPGAHIDHVHCTF